MLIKKLRKLFFYNDYSIAIYGVLLIIVAGILNLNINKPIIELSKQETALNINKNLLVYMSAGHKRLISDLLWVQTLIESDLEHYKQKDLNNWLFLRFNTISILDPYFYENYLFGGLFLAIIKDDLEGADFIYDKGLKYYPLDYQLNYNAGFLNYFEMGNAKKGLELFTRIENNPKAPVFLKSIINKLKLETGTDLNTIFKLVLHNYETTQEKTLKEKLRKDLYAIKAEIDLKCLNSKLLNCDKQDFDGNLYEFDSGKFKAQKLFNYYRINKRR